MIWNNDAIKGNLLPGSQSFVMTCKNKDNKLIKYQYSIIDCFHILYRKLYDGILIGMYNFNSNQIVK